MTGRVEIDARELARLQQVAGIADKLWNDSEVGMAVKKRAKTYFPDLNVPEVDTEAALAAREKAHEEKLAKLKEETETRVSAIEKMHLEAQEKQKAEREEAALRERIEATARANGLTETGKARMIERLMEMKGSDVEGAALYVKSLEPSPRPTASGFMPARVNPFGANDGGDSWKELNMEVLNNRGGAPVSWAEKQIHEILNDPQYL